MPEHPDRLPLTPDASADRKLYVALQATFGVALAAVLLILSMGGSRPAAIVSMVLWFALTRAFYRVARRGRWFDEDAGALWPRLLGAGLVLGVVWGYASLVAYAHLDGTALREALRPFDGFLGVLSAYALVFHVFVALLWTTLLAAGHFVLRYRRAEVIALRLAVEAKDAELRALRAQVHPHFLFNALNAVRALIDEDPARARDAVTRLSRLLRHTLRASEQPRVPLADELDATRDYLALEAVRFEERLRVTVRVEGETEGVNVPPLVLLTLAENAVKHGIAPSAAGGEVALVVTNVGGVLRLAVTSPGALGPATGGGLGLRNTRARLALDYGPAATLHVGDDGAGAVTSELRLPILTP